MTPEQLWAAVAPLLTDPEQRAAMAERACERGRPDAAERLVDVVLAAACR